MRRPAVLAMTTISVAILGASYQAGAESRSGTPSALDPQGAVEPTPDAAAGPDAGTDGDTDGDTDQGETPSPEPPVTMTMTVEPSPSVTPSPTSTAPSATPAGTTTTPRTSAVRPSAPRTTARTTRTTRAPQPTTAPPATTPPATSSPPTSRPPAVVRTVTGERVTTGWGPVQVRLTVTDGVITASTAIRHPKSNDTSVEINAYALPLLEKQVIAAQSADIDGVSGATVTSGGYRTSLQSALDKLRS